MSLQYLRNFVAVVENGTISAASREVHIAQSALTHQMKMLEFEYGAVLFHRGPRSIVLTEAGRILYTQARQICNIEDATRQTIKDYNIGISGVLRLALSPAYPNNTINNLLIGFHRENPKVQYEIFEGNSKASIENLKNNVSEIGILRTSAYISPRLNPLLSTKESYMAVYSIKNPWCPPDLSTLEIRDLKDIPLSFPRGFQNVIVDACLAEDFYPNIFNVSNSRETALFWAQQGAAIAILTAASPEDEIYIEGMNHCQIQGHLLSKTRFIATLRDHTLSVVGKNFISYCKKNLPTWSAPP